MIDAHHSLERRDKTLVSVGWDTKNSSIVGFGSVSFESISINAPLECLGLNTLESANDTLSSFS